jgi:hypothetical protein
VTITATAAQAQATRTWVSGVGDDAFPCSRTAPCKTFAGAISKTATAASSTSWIRAASASVTITKSLTIDGSGGSIAGVTAVLTQGMIVNSATAIVHLRNLQLDSPTAGSQGINGVNVIAASQVHIEHCVISGFSNSAVNFQTAGSLFVNDTTIQNNTSGGIVVGNGRATIDRLFASGNGNAVVVTGPRLVSVSNSTATGGSAGFRRDRQRAPRC